MTQKRHSTNRKPATKFAQLRKKMDQSKLRMRTGRKGNR
jgi:hypothetical protein